MMKHYRIARLAGLLFSAASVMALSLVLILISGAYGTGNALASGTPVRLVSVNGAGTGSGNSWSGLNGIERPAINADGRFVAFVTLADNLVDNDINGSAMDVFVRDLVSGKTILVSVNSAGTGSGNGASLAPAISADGRFVAFLSEASDLVDNDTNGFTRDVFVRDLETGTTRLVSVNHAGTGSGNGVSPPIDSGYGDPHPKISADGRIIAFFSEASDLVAERDANGQRDVFARDMVAGKTMLVSVNRTGRVSGNNESHNPVLSTDGRFVAFESFANNLVANDTNVSGYFGGDIFIRDLIAKNTKLVTVNPAGTRSGNDYSSGASLSDDGRFVAFSSNASNLVDNDTNERNDAFIRDMLTGKTMLVSVNESGTASGNDNSSSGSISADGRFVSFVSAASDLVPGYYLPSYAHLYYRDVVAGKTVLVDVDKSGTRGSLYPPDGISMSADGRFIAFHSPDEALTGNDTNYGYDDVFVRDMVTGTTRLVSVNHTGRGSGNLSSRSATISADGRAVAFTSMASDLVTNDTNGEWQDIFVASLAGGALQFSAAAYTVNENQGTASIEVERTGGSQGIAKVKYATRNSTARAGKDYTATTGVLTFADGETRKTFTVTISDDALDEKDKAINLTLTILPGRALTGAQNTATLTIIDDDPTPTLSINDVGMTEANTGTISAVFTVKLSAASSQTITVDFETINGTARTNIDFVAASGTLSFAPGQVVKTITVEIVGDTRRETNETLKVKLSQPTNSKLLDAQGIGTILNDD